MGAFRAAPLCNATQVMREAPCEGEGGTAAVIALLTLLLAACLCCRRAPPKRPEDRGSLDG